MADFVAEVADKRSEIRGGGFSRTPASPCLAAGPVESGGLGAGIPTPLYNSDPT